MNPETEHYDWKHKETEFIQHISFLYIGNLRTIIYARLIEINYLDEGNVHQTVWLLTVQQSRTEWNCGIFRITPYEVTFKTLMAY